MNKKNILLILLSIGFLFSQSQTIIDTTILEKKQNKILKKQAKRLERKDKNRFLVLGLGGGITKYKDLMVSPLLYKGNNNSMLLNYLVIGNKKINWYEFNLNTASINIANKDIYQGSSGTLISSAFNYYTVFKLKEFNEKNRLYFGGHSINNLILDINTKYMNSALVYNMFSEIGFTFRFDKSMQWKAKKLKFLFLKINRRDRQLRLSHTFSFPFYAFINRPEYAGISNFVDGKTGISYSQYISTVFGKYKTLNLKTELIYELGNYNLIKIAYNWDFLSYKQDYNFVQAANHYFMLSIAFKINNNKKSINNFNKIKNE